MRGDIPGMWKGGKKCNKTIMIAIMWGSGVKEMGWIVCVL
jgi:hypothetical protein